MSIGSLFSRLPGVGAFFRRHSLFGLAAKTAGLRLRRPFTAALRKTFPSLGFRPAQTITRIAFEAAAAGRRLQGVGTRRALAINDVPIVPPDVSNPALSDRFETTVTYEWFDEQTGLSGFSTDIVGTNDVPDIETVNDVLMQAIIDGRAGGSPMNAVEDRSGVIIDIRKIDLVTRSY